jgi:type IV pilus assembly protein PilA
MYSLNPRIKFFLIDGIQSTRTSASAAFTLVELMIVVAIIGLLSAVALPQFLSTRDRADAKAKIGELVGLSKECGTFNAEADMTSSTVFTPNSTVSIVCGGSSPASLTMSSKTWRVSLSIDCVGTSINAKRAKMAIDPSGRLTCSASS